MSGGRAALALLAPVVISLGLLRPAAARAAPADTARRLLEGARLSIDAKPRYDPAYVRLAYPGGDPGADRGVCSDVVVRAFRHVGIDLQARLREDVDAPGAPYRIDAPDPSIDHRRVRNLIVFFARHAAAVPIDRDWRAGDIVVWDLYGGSSPNHVGIVSDRTGESGRPLVVHHFPRTAGFTGFPSEDDCLDRWRVIAHFRWPEPPDEAGAPQAP
jgi:uncharacterized protein YijF (DUF1287 family)